MKAAFALLLDYQEQNFVRKLAVRIHQKYQIGFAGSQLPPHVSLKQPFQIADLPAVEAYFDALASSIDPLVISFNGIGGPPSNAPILWLDVKETTTLRQLHTRINQELAEPFPNTQAPFDGPNYHFHATIAIGGQPAEVYDAICAEFANRKIALTTIASQLALFYYDDDQFSPGSFFTYKVLPLGQGAKE